MYKMITGKTPPDAMERRAKYENQNKDILEDPHKLNKNISVNRENAILNAMNVRIEDRTQDIPSFIKELNADPPAKRRYGKIKKLDVYSWPLWIKILIPTLLVAVITAGVLMATGIISFSRYSGEVVIPENIVIAPDVEGMNNEEAIKAIERDNLLASIGGSIESEYISAGKVVIQTPVGGAFLEKNGTVLLIISTGKEIEGDDDGSITVPFLVGRTIEEAIEKLNEKGLGIPIIEQVNDDNFAAGLVISQSIDSDKKVEAGTVLTLKVSTGPSTFKIPNTVGQNEAAAKATLASSGLIVTVEYEKSNTVAEGNVIRQNPAENTEVKRGEAVTIWVSTGKNTVTVNNVVGKTQSEAENILKSQGFKVTVIEAEDTSAKGTVIRQSPEAGTSQEEGTTITIFVSTGKKEIAYIFIFISLLKF